MSEPVKKYILEPLPFKADLKIDYRKDLNDEQYQVVTNLVGPCLVLAGAGSGKTRALTYRVAYMIEQGINPKEILLMTFTNKAAKEMMVRVEVLLKSHPKGLWGGTFHHVGNRLLRMYGKHIGIPNDFVILDSEDAKDLIKTCLAELSSSKDKYFPKADGVLRIISMSINTGESISDVVTNRFSYLDESVIEPIEAIAKRYAEKKQAAKSLDYDDLLAKWLLLMQSPDVSQKLSAMFKYVLVDEYQDTNYIQSSLVKSLAGVHGNVLAVGDDAQSIYSFRGATVENILQFPQVFPDAKTFKIETNYRSTPEILSLANASIRNNARQFEKDLKTIKPQAEKPILASCYDGSEQAAFVCQRIMELHQEGVELNEIAILFRAHYQSLEIELELSKRSIPYVMRGGLRFFEQAHIKDVIAYLKACSNLQDQVAWLRILKLYPGVGDVTANKIWQWVSSHNNLNEVVSDAGNLSVGKAVGWNSLVDVLSGIAKLGFDNISSVISHIISAGYRQHVLTVFENAQDRMDDLNQLTDYASRYEKLEDLLADVALSEGFKGDSVAKEQEISDEAVILSTVHQAKGLEWKAVFVIGLSEGQFPHAKVNEFPDQLEEERRLFYVAVTRAKEMLYMTYPTVSIRGDVFSRPSRFITELPSNTYQKWEIGLGSRRDYNNLNDGEVSYIDEEGDGSILDIYLKQNRRY